ncbi:hypothetical protein CDAR_89941 [Caerostris darwini]|uniref:Uncharacterized protein n=1 Tax=Caerostris darwini TaxID=1538125 RepID=A0AAV4RIZ8_9ARAC|nr:hypothetical protein CDAR_89941 [Caerostris darwini]
MFYLKPSTASGSRRPPDDQAYHMGHREEARVWPPRRQDNSLLGRRGWYQRPTSHHTLSLSPEHHIESRACLLFFLPIQKNGRWKDWEIPDNIKDLRGAPELY